MKFLAAFFKLIIILLFVFSLGWLLVFYGEGDIVQLFKNFIQGKKITKRSVNLREEMRETDKKFRENHFKIK